MIRRSVWAAPLAVALVVATCMIAWTAQGQATARGHAKGGDIGLLQVGARCDGVHDDRAALAAAVRRVAHGGGGTVWVPDGTCRILATSSHPSIVLPDGVVVRGRSARSRLVLDSDAPAQFRQLFSVRGDDVGIRNLRITRARDIYTVLIGLDASRNFTMSDVVLDGFKRDADGREVAGIMLHPRPGSRIVGASLRHVTIRRVGYGVFQPSTTEGETHGFWVVDSTFTRNWADDLEFNAPATTMTDVQVVNSSFTHHRTPATAVGAGYAVGLAHVSRARIKNNTFRGYEFEPIHIEDRSSKVLIHRNEFSDAGTAETGYAAHMLIVGDVQDVRITGNSFDATTNGNSHVDCIHLGGGGLPVGPDQILVAHNLFRLGPRSSAVGEYLATNVTLEENTVEQFRP